MSTVPNPELPRLVSLRSMIAEGADWHTHPFFELVLVTDDVALLGFEGTWRDVKPNTLLLYARNERHGGVVAPGRTPRFWVIHFDANEAEPGALAELLGKTPTRRAWELSATQAESFQWHFFHLMRERSGARPGFEEANTSWLRLLFVAICRLGTESAAVGPVTTKHLRPEVVKLWHSIHGAVHQTAKENERIFSAPSYDSLRHAFRSAYGCSPRDMLVRLRMENAKNLLLETNLSVKEIATRIGFGRQHDFYRVFRREVGRSPSEWRQRPL